MAIFYKVKDEIGKVYSGVSETEDIKSLKKTLRDRGWYVIKVFPIKKGRRVVFRGKVSLEELILFTHQFSSMLEAGIPILRALDILWKQVSNLRLQVVISQLRDKLGQGKSLSDGLNEFPDVFSLLYRAVINVAETGAGLVPVMRKLIEYLNKESMVNSRIKRATIYPLLVIIFALLVVIFLLIWVIPTFQEILRDLNVGMPILTQIILGISTLMRSIYFWVGSGIVLFLLFISYKKYYSTPSGRYKIDALKLKLPIFGNIIYTTLVTRFTFSLNLLLEAGLPIARSIRTTKEVVINQRIAKELETVERKITQGYSLSKALTETGIFPALLCQMVAVGEESGNLSDMLKKVNTHFEEELDYRLHKFLTALEPLLIIFVGGIVAFILLAIYLPIFKMWQGVINMP